MLQWKRFKENDRTHFFGFFFFFCNQFITQNGVGWGECQLQPCVSLSKGCIIMTFIQKRYNVLTLKLHSYYILLLLLLLHSYILLLPMLAHICTYHLKPSDLRLACTRAEAIWLLLAPCITWFGASEDVDDMSVWSGQTCLSLARDVTLLHPRRTCTTFQPSHEEHPSVRRNIAWQR